MNIFVLDENPILAARAHCDKHVTKMIVESAQMLSTAHCILDGDKVDPRLYKIAYKNHPCTIWARECKGNYHWLYELFLNLSYEFNYRYDKVHKSWSTLHEALFFPPTNIPPSEEIIARPMCMPIEFKKDGNAVTAYRKYYNWKQSQFSMVWTKRQPPTWLS